MFIDIKPISNQKWSDNANFMINWVIMQVVSLIKRVEFFVYLTERCFLQFAAHESGCVELGVEVMFELLFFFVQV